MSDVTPNPARDPEDWVTGDEPATGPQRSFVRTLSQEADEDIDADEVSKGIPGHRPPPGTNRARRRLSRSRVIGPVP